MSERASVFEATQIGVEGEPGTVVDADVKLLATSIEPSIQAETVSFRPPGAKFATASFMGKEWTKAAIKGQAAYNDLAYLLAGLLSNPTPEAEGDGWKRTFTPAQSEPDEIVTYSVEAGSSVRAAGFAYGLIRELSIKADRSGVEISGEMIGGLFTDDITMTEAPTEVEIVPILPNQVSIYADDSAAGLGTTKLERVLSTEISISNRFEALWTLDSENKSFAAHLETAPDATMKLLMEADDVGMALLESMRTGAKMFVRFEAAGPAIDLTHDYLLQFDLCGTVTDVSPGSDQDGVYAIEWTLQMTYDATWEAALEVVLINTVAALVAVP